MAEEERRKWRERVPWKELRNFSLLSLLVDGRPAWPLIARVCERLSVASQEMWKEGRKEGITDRNNEPNKKEKKKKAKSQKKNQTQTQRKRREDDVVQHDRRKGRCFGFGFGLSDRCRARHRGQRKPQREGGSACAIMGEGTEWKARELQEVRRPFC